MQTIQTKHANNTARWLIALCAFMPAVAGRTEIVDTNLPTLVVTASPVEAPAWVTPGASVADALALDPRIWLRAQGSANAQSDLSIRGSSFTEAGLAVNGLSLRNPQTEHFNAELPIPAALLTPPQVLTGMDQTLGSDGHAAGVVDVGFRPVPSSGRRLVDAGVGEIDRNWQTLIVEQPVCRTGPDGRISVGGFASFERARELDYPDNDLERAGGGVHIQSLTPQSQVDMIVANQHKTFGAQGYYGVNPDLPAEEQLDDTLALAAMTWGSARSHVSASTAWRAIEDAYQLELPTGLYANQHRSTVWSSIVQGRHAHPNGWGVNWQTGAELQSLDSARLGDQTRRRAAFALLPQWGSDRVRLVAGARTEAFTDDSPAVLPQAEIRLALSRSHTIHVSSTETVRQPSFTELNYESPGSLGNQGLERETAREVETGWRWAAHPRLSVDVNAFHRRTWNTVDWIRETAESVQWMATDLGTVDTRGMEARVACLATDRLRIDASYTALDKRDDVDVYAGRYVLDYPRQRARLEASWDVSECVRLSASQAWQEQSSNPVRTSDDAAFDGRMAIRVSPPWPGEPVITLAADNLWDDDFQALPGQRATGRRAWAGLTLAW